MGTTGAFSSTSVLFPPQTSIRTSDTSVVDDPEAPVTLMRSAPNPNEIWRVTAGEVLKTFLIDTDGNQMSGGTLYIGKRLLGGLGTRYYHVQPFNMISAPDVEADINFAQRMQQSLRVHAGEELVLAVNDGGSKAWDASQASNQVQISFEVASGVTPAQNSASLRRWG